ncbi:MAG: hypothetical protein ACI32B_07150 [Erysipelotrichaceae bacterium]
MKNQDLVYNYRKVIVLAIACAIVIVIAIAGFSMSWFTAERELDMMTMIKTPIMLELKSGKNHDIVYLDMGNIDVESGQTSKDYVFCVYGEPIDYYSLQFAHTTNIPFNYTISRAKYISDTEPANSENYIKFTFEDDEGMHKEWFEKTNIVVIDTNVSSEIKEQHKQHKITYKTDISEEDTYDNVQTSAEPLYWLARENDLTSLYPSGQGKVNNSFYDYYILTISWDKNAVNNKETDMVYISVSF